MEIADLSVSQQGANISTHQCEVMEKSDNLSHNGQSQEAKAILPYTQEPDL